MEQLGREGRGRKVTGSKRSKDRQNTRGAQAREGEEEEEDRMTGRRRIPSGDRI